MKKSNFNLSVCLLILVIFLSIFLIYQNFVLNKQIAIYSQKIEESLTKTLTEQMNLQSEIINENFLLVNQKIDILSEKEINEISGIKNNVVKMKKTYDKILQTEQEKHIDNSLFDIAMQEKFDSAKKMFNQKDYSKALILLKSIMEFDSSNLEVRFYKMLSTFYINKMDSSMYSEVLSDCKILKESGYKDERIDEIENFIIGEQQ